uniref:U5 small nuclear ribonucleoprotein TSSC4 n=1 Tax=Xiphophorus couchianus TaxID=32473 RepID=A0A3B5MJ58_9TELE
MECLYHDIDEDGEVMTSVSPSAPAAQSSFSLSGASSGFSFRSRSIFDCLDSVEKRSVTPRNQGNSAESRKTSHPPSTSPIPQKKRGVPDYLVHPERWTRYSLEDVAESRVKCQNNSCGPQCISFCLMFAYH